MRYFMLLCFMAACGATHGQHPDKRTIQPGDIYRLITLGDLQISPEGSWIAYTETRADSSRDKYGTHIWMTSWDGSSTLQLTNGEDGDETPRWSPDGKFLSFISSRQGGDDSKLYVIDRRGGEGQRLLEVKGKLLDYAWSPDASRIALVVKDPDYADTAKTKTRPPYVMDRYHFKQDVEGYLDGRNTHLYVFNLQHKTTDTLTRGRYDESSPAWSPDGSQLVFVSNRTEDPDRNENTDLWIMPAVAGGQARRLTTWKGADSNPVWSPDGKFIAYLQSSSEEDFTMYGHAILALVSKDGGTPRLLSKDLDRPVRTPRWSADASSVAVLVADDRKSLPVIFSIKDGSMKKLAEGDCSYSDLACRKSGSWAALMSTPQLPSEIYVLENQVAKRITHAADSLFNTLALSKVTGFRSTSSDGTLVSGMLYMPPGKVPGGKWPLILFIHGGPVDQDSYEFYMERQSLAAGGFAVAAVNYRGSYGRGVDYCRAIFADWGNKEVKDIVGAADFLIASGVADSTKMGIAGWSYGGILTDYVIASDNRFRAASSGAGSALQLSMYGVDEYVNQYNNELGPPWEHLDTWLKLSYPFLRANRIKTPTLFMASQADFNVPSAGAEQMYQALRTLHVPTQLVIYPGQFHEITVPSYQVDRLQRWLVWFGRYLK